MNNREDTADPIAPADMAEEETTSEEDIKPFFTLFSFLVFNVGCTELDYLMSLGSHDVKLVLSVRFGFLKS